MNPSIVNSFSMFFSFGNGQYNIITHNHALTVDIQKYYDLQKRLNFSLMSLFNLFSTFYSTAANRGHPKSKSIFKVDL